MSGKEGETVGRGNVAICSAPLIDTAVAAAVAAAAAAAIAVGALVSCCCCLLLGICLLESSVLEGSLEEGGAWCDSTGV